MTVLQMLFQFFSLRSLHCEKPSLKGKKKKICALPRFLCTGPKFDVEYKYKIFFHDFSDN